MLRDNEQFSHLKKRKKKHVLFCASKYSFYINTHFFHIKTDAFIYVCPLERNQTWCYFSVTCAKRLMYICVSIYVNSQRST